MNIEEVLKKIEGSRDLNLAYYRQIKDRMVSEDDFKGSSIMALREFKRSASVYGLCAKMISEALHEDH